MCGLQWRSLHKCPTSSSLRPEIEIPDGDAVTKLGLLLSGLYVPGTTAVAEGMLSIDHAERALMTLGAGIQTQGAMTLLDRSEKRGSWPGFEWQIPGDFSLACWLMAAALSVPGSDVIIEGVGLNRTRSAFLEVLSHGGAAITVTPKGDLAGDEPGGGSACEELAPPQYPRGRRAFLSRGPRRPCFVGTFALRGWKSLRA